MNDKFTQKMGNPASPMGQRIEAAKAREEADLTAKIERSRAADVDVRSFFTDEELAALLDDNDSFNGTIADLSKMERYKRACAAAKWLEANSIEVVKVESDGVSHDRPTSNWGNSLMTRGMICPMSKAHWHTTVLPYATLRVISVISVQFWTMYMPNGISSARSINGQSLRRLPVHGNRKTS